MSGTSSFNLYVNYQAGGGASCSGVGFDLSYQIAGRPVVINNAIANCLFGEVANFDAVLSGGEMNTVSPAMSGGGRRKGRGRGKGKKVSNKRAKGVKIMAKRNKTVVKNAINKYCKSKKIKCSQATKNKIYNTVIEKLCV